ncbi:MAG: P1 family peptidase [Calditrichaeota bacterium]|nr:P1 family peptidase [Calditrichota bacterium]
MKFLLLVALFLFTQLPAQTLEENWRQLQVGILEPGKWNAITDVPGVRVGHLTLIQGEDCRTGVTVILPHPGNIFQEKVPAAIYTANGFGKLMGVTQVEELGVIETPIVLTNTLSVPDAARGLIDYVLQQPGNEAVRSVNPVVGETNDGRLNNIRARYVRPEHVAQAIQQARSGPVPEGNVGAGTGTVCFGFKGGIGTASRKLPESLGGFTVGVLVQSNFGGTLQINGAPVGLELGQYYLKRHVNPRHDGSCMIVVATDAPLNARQLKRLARRAIYGLVRTGGISTHGSGDYVIAFSTRNRVPYGATEREFQRTVLSDDHISPLFQAVVEATEEAIYHSLFAAETMTGYRGRTVEALPLKRVEAILKKYGALRFRK